MFARTGVIVQETGTRSVNPWVHRGRDITVGSDRHECCASCSGCSPDLAVKSKLAQPWLGVPQTSLHEPSDTDARRTATQIGRHVSVCGNKTRYRFGNSCSGVAEPSLQIHSLRASDQKRLACTKISRGPTIKTPLKISAVESRSPLCLRFQVICSITSLQILSAAPAGLVRLFFISLFTKSAVTH